MSYDLNKAAKHVVHDYVYLVAAGHDTQNPLAHPYNHYAERTFLVHCRAFAGFFKNGSDTRDMYAKDFMGANQQLTSTLDDWEKWHVHTDQHLAHLAQARIDNTRAWTGEDNKKILDGFRTTWRDFYTKLNPLVKPAFDTAISAMQQEFPNIRL